MKKRNIKKRLASLLIVAAFVITMAPLSPIKASASFTGALQFDANGKFTVMQVADVQTNTSVPSRVVAAITNNIARYHPDLVVFTGDNIYEGISSAANFQSAVNSFLAPILSTNTKFAITFGNHDSDGSGGSLSSQYAYYKSHGGSNFIDQDVTALTGDASGVISIYPYGQTSGTPAYDVYLMDSGHSPSSGSYDGCYTNQVDYYIQRSQTYPNVPSLWFQHVIVPDINSRCMTSTNNGTGVSYGGLYIDTARINYARSSSSSMSDIYKEATCPPSTSVYESAAHRSSASYGSKTLYEAWRDYGNLKGAYFGHDHLNEFTCTTSDGIDLGYGESTTLYKTLGIVNYNDGNPGVSIYQLDADGTYTNEYSAETDIAKAMVAYDSNGGIGTVKDQLVAKNSSVTLNANAFTKSGYTFSGWNTKADGTGTSYANGATVTVGTADIILYAKWTASTVNITFDANSGTGGTGPTAMTPGAALTAPTVTRTGYTFTGWSPAVPAAVPSANTTYTAQWSATGYTVTFEAGTGGTVTPLSKSVTYDSAYGMLPAAPDIAKTGYTFGGWWSGAGGTGTQITAGTTVSTASDHSLYARWAANTFQINYNGNGSTGGSMSPCSNFIYDEAPANLTPNGFTKTGHTFLGWSTDSTATTPAYTDGQSVLNLTTVPNDSINFYAVWAVNQYTVSFDANGGTGSAAAVKQDYDTSVALPLTGFAKAGYTFIGWNTAPDSTTAISSCRVPDGDVTLYAVYTVNQYTVTFDANGGTGSEVQTVSYGVTPSAPAVEKEGNTFKGWSPEVTAVTGDITYVARWEPILYSAKFYVDSTLYGDYGYYFGDTVAKPLDPTKGGFTFAGWDLTVPGTMPAENLVFNALWTPITLQAPPDSTTVINTAQNLIYGLKPGLTQAEFESDYVHTNGEGKLVYTPAADVLGTGTKVDLIDQSTGTVLQTFYIVIFGDVNGDGIVSAADADVCVDVQNWKVSWDEQTQGYNYLAGDLNGDGNVDALDADLMTEVANWRMHIDQATGRAVIGV